MVKSLRSAFVMLSMCFAVAVSAQTKQYTQDLVVSVNGVSTDPQSTTVDVEFLEDDYINFTLKNFCLVSEGSSMPIGNIAVSDLKLRKKTQYDSFYFNDNLVISAGEDASLDWLGPNLGNIPVSLYGKVTDDNLYVTIDINLVSLGQIISVNLGSDFAPATVVSTKKYNVKQTGTFSTNPILPWETTATATVYSDGDMDIAIDNVLLLLSEEDGAPMGNVKFSHIESKDMASYKSFAFNGNVTFSSGDTSIIPEWLGGAVGNVMTGLTGKMTDDNIYISLNLYTDNIFNGAFYLDYNTDFAPVTVTGTKNYTENLVVTVNGVSTEPQPTTISVDNLSNGNINFSLKNFKLIQGGDEMGIGNIEINDLATEKSENGYDTFFFNGYLQIKEGSDASVPMWLGPNLGNIPVKLKGKKTADKLFVTIDIIMESLGQTIHVQLGEDITKEMVSVKSVVVSSNNSNIMYNLSGQRVSNTAKGGIYILNGKKYVK